MQENTFVFYHANCIDGYAAAWAAWKVLGNKASYQAVRHNSDMPTITQDSVVYIVDFCYSAEVLIAAAKIAKKVVILDHHISAQKELDAYRKEHELPSNLEINFVQEHSGCVIAWQYFHKETAVPPLLLHIEDNDLWRHVLDKTDAICKALYLCLPEKFSEFENINLADLKLEGAVLLKQQKLSVKKLLKARHSIELAGKKGLAVNAPSMYASDLGHELALISGTYGVVYSYQGSRECYECGIRSNGEYDVSKIALQFDGGGHKNASGFRLAKKDFVRLVLE
ncbi:MAG: DHH family phosphoesterase [Methyloprofundus sp.]|nr:DHH family phosphoesterase [Methyloprofundus sp.]